MKFYPNHELSSFVYLNVSRWIKKVEPPRPVRRTMQKLADKFRGTLLFVDLSPDELGFLKRFHQACYVLRQDMEEKSPTEINTRKFGRFLDQLHDLLSSKDNI